MSSNNEAFGDEDDLANEEYERQEQEKEEHADELKYTEERCYYLGDTLGKK